MNRSEPTSSLYRAPISQLLSILRPRSLYILLYWQRDSAVRFHWALYHHINSSVGGYEFDIVRPTRVWAPSVPYGIPQGLDILDPDPTSEPLACAVRIGVVEPGDKKGMAVRELVRAEDERLNELGNEELGGEKLSCRVYVRRACGRLQEEGLLPSPPGNDWEEVEKEVLETGNWNEDFRGKVVFVVDSDIMNLGSGQE